ncbi:MAG: hypothetical protein FWE34_00785 [Defluviitaleaceae bacterium]|nr:hypothetical protein [Defluviitaleaceae bacterium]
MNIIRSKVVELNTIPAIAYKIRLKQGGSGIKIHRTDRDETAFVELDKRSGGIVPNAHNKLEFFPEEAFDEAIAELVGLAYSARGKVRFIATETVEDGEIEVPEDEAPGTHEDATANVVDSDEFIAIVDMYSDEWGKLNFPLMNKQFIQFASKNKTVSEMIGDRAGENEILIRIVQNRAAFLANNRDFISDDEAAALIDVLDDMCRRSAFKELKLHIRKMLSR